MLFKATIWFSYRQQFDLGLSCGRCSSCRTTHLSAGKTAPWKGGKFRTGPYDRRTALRHSVVFGQFSSERLRRGRTGDGEQRPPERLPGKSNWRHSVRSTGSRRPYLKSRWDTTIDRSTVAAPRNFHAVVVLLIGVLPPRRRPLDPVQCRIQDPNTWSP